MSKAGPSLLSCLPRSTLPRSLNDQPRQQHGRWRYCTLTILSEWAHPAARSAHCHCHWLPMVEVPLPTATHAVSTYSTVPVPSTSFMRVPCAHPTTITASTTTTTTATNTNNNNNNNDKRRKLSPHDRAGRGRSTMHSHAAPNTDPRHRSCSPGALAWDLGYTYASSVFAVAAKL